MVEYLGLKLLLIILVIFLVIWDMTWKAIAMWKAAQNNQVVWFILLFILNTGGILPIIYILFCQKDMNEKKKQILKPKIKTL